MIPRLLSASAMPDLYYRSQRQRRPYLWLNDPPSFEFEDVPLDEARRISSGTRMNPELYHVFTEKIESLDNTATRLTIPDGTRTTTVKKRILRVAAELGISVTVRRVPGDLLFWHLTDEDLQQSIEVMDRLQSFQRQRKTAHSSEHRAVKGNSAHEPRS